jgi:hypothetical protein
MLQDLLSKALQILCLTKDLDLCIFPFGKGINTGAIEFSYYTANRKILNILSVAGLASAFFVILSIVFGSKGYELGIFGVWDGCIKHWKYLWVDEIFWSSLFFVLLFLNMVVWNQKEKSFFHANLNTTISLVYDPKTIGDKIPVNEALLIDKIDDVEV